MERAFLQDNIHAELDSVLPFEDSPLNVHTMGELKYLQSTMKESIRFYTPVPVIARCLKEPVVLGKIEILNKVGKPPNNGHFRTIFFEKLT